MKIVLNVQRGAESMKIDVEITKEEIPHFIKNLEKELTEF